MGVGEVVQLLDGLPDALGELLADDRRAVDGARNCGDGDFGQSSHGPNIGSLVAGFANGFPGHEEILSTSKDN